MTAEKARQFYKELTGKYIEKYEINRFGKKGGSKDIIGELNIGSPEEIFSFIEQKKFVLKKIFLYYKRKMAYLKDELDEINEDKNPEIDSNKEYIETKEEIELVQNILSNKENIDYQLNAKNNHKALFTHFLVLLGDLARMDPVSMHHAQTLIEEIKQIKSKIEDLKQKIGNKSECSSGMIEETNHIIKELNRIASKKMIILSKIEKA